jgi:peroxiredoxin
MRKNPVLLFLVLLLSFLTFTNLRAEEKTLAPDFKLQDLSGAFVQLNSFRDRKSVLMFFWTSWCPYCLKELKVLNNKLKKLEEEGVELLAINVEEPASKADRVIKNYKLVFRVFLDGDSSVANSYGIVGVPSFVLVDKKGYIRFVDNYFPQEEVRRLSQQ